MSLLKVNIEKPALVEERVYPNEDSAPATATTNTKSSDSSDSSGPSVLKPLLGLLFVVGAALFVYKRRSGGEDDESELDVDEFESESSGHGKTARTFGLLASFLGLALVARKRRRGNENE